MSSASEALPAPRGALNRALRLFGDVRPDESLLTLVQVLNLFALLVGYYILKTVREPLILESGAEMKSYAAAAQAAALMLFIPLYGWLGSKVDRLNLIKWVLVFFLVTVELFTLGLRFQVPYLGFVFYVWVGIFSLATIAQFWSFANDVYTRVDGERLFPVIAIGATAGSPLGSKIAGMLFEAGVRPATMMHLTALLLLAHLGLYYFINAQYTRRGGGRDAHTQLSGPGGFALVFHSRYLMLIAGLLILLNVVNTTGEYIISKSALAAFKAAQAVNPGIDKEAFLGGFFGDYYFWVSVLAVVLQAFVASRIVKAFGIAGVLFALPLVSLGAYSLFGLGVAFSVARWGKTAENATDYSIMNTARQMLWLPTSREEKYKAKQTLDTFFVRAGDVVSAGIVFLATEKLGLDVAGFGRVNVVLTLVWLGMALVLVRENRRLVALTERG